MFGGKPMNIEHLVERGKTEDKLVISELIERFTPLILKIVSSIYIKGYEKEDLIQIGYLSIIKSVREFDLDRGGSFVPYVYNAVRKNYYNEIRKAAKSNYETSYEKLVDTGDYSKLSRVEKSVEDNIIRREEICNLKTVLDKLTEEEKDLIRFSYGVGYGGLKKYSELYKVKYVTAQKRKSRVIIKLRGFHTKIKE